MATTNNINNLMPADATATITCLTEALDWSKLKLEQWKVVAAELGDESVDDLPTIAAIGNDDWMELLQATRSNAIVKARVNLFVNAIRKAVGMDISDLVAPKPQATVAATQQQVVVNAHVPANEDPRALPVRHYFDQGCKLIVQTVAADELKVMRDRWTLRNSLEPGTAVNPSDNQLSVLKRLADLDHNLLAFDMGVWGPYSTRRERQQMLTVHHQNAAGAWVAKEVPGAHCLDDWLEAWAFATTGFVMGEIVTVGVADAYRDNFKKLCDSYPTSWWICCQAEWEFRFEFAVDELRRQKDFHAAAPTVSAFDPAQPWNSVLLAGTRGIESMSFWEDRLKEKARNWVSSGRSQVDPSWIRRQSDMFLANGGGGRQVWLQGEPKPQPNAAANPNGSGKGAGRRGAKRLRNEAAPTKGEEWKDAKGADGRYRYAKNGADFCYSWGRNANGCGPDGTPCPDGRAHSCEWCRDGHKSIACPVHPHWVPPRGKGEKGKGKGKGKGKKA